MSRKTIVSDYFTFSKIQRRSILFAVSIVIVCIAVRFSYRYFVTTETIPADTAFLQQAALLTRPDTSRNQYATWHSGSTYPKEDNGDEAIYLEPADKYTTGKHKPKGELFQFDPNTLDAAGWKRLGLRDRTISTIQNYRAKGGRFRQPEDIHHIYGLFPDEAERLLPYIKIATTTPKDFPEKSFPKNEMPVSFAKPVAARLIDINTADTAAFVSLPGIGSKRASQIIRFRESLGGFHSVEQIGETYGLPDSVFQKIKSRLVVNAISIKKININTADATALKANSYIRWNVANAIYQYRQQHGNYTLLNDLKKIALIDEQLFLKLQPYLTIE